MSGPAAKGVPPRLKIKPQVGRMPTLQFCRPDELRIDPAYQRGVDNGPSQALIRRIAQEWNWDLCQPLVVARRVDFMERLFVIDGQHRLEAARLRGDIGQLPCVIGNYDGVEAEAASFVKINQERRPLSKLDVFKAAVASGDALALAIMDAVAQAGLALANTTNPDAWKPGQITNVGGLQLAWQRHGAEPVYLALRAIAEAFAGEVLRYAGSIFPGVAALCAEGLPREGFRETEWPQLVELLRGRTQAVWRQAMLQRHGADPGLNYPAAMELVLRDAWAAADGLRTAPPAANAARPESATGPAETAGARAGAIDFAPPPATGPRWCDQCDCRVTQGEAASCKSRFCSLRQAG